MSPPPAPLPPTFLHKGLKQDKENSKDSVSGAATSQKGQMLNLEVGLLSPPALRTPAPQASPGLTASPGPMRRARFPTAFFPPLNISLGVYF